uniref:Reverse transcriptase domain-containing protein n=1 Tax=Vitis vinifera TaxID=29760 RepID=A5BY85_VITVI|nr:hypothetical protein VITISV_029728 [Vitis vinifera]
MDKAPGPDGFTIAMFQDCWDVIKKDLVRVFAEFHKSGIINQSTNASFIVLLPKKSMSKKISDYRPISLITSIYKIIAKVLAGRLRGILHETIHFTQGAFVQGRRILDAILIANEIVDEKKRSGEEGVVFKIDFEKAYDHVSWNFLDHVLEKKGFSPRWRKWMIGCLSSVSFAILVNGNVKEWVKASKESLSRLAELLDCKASGWPILYLGLPLEGNLKACGFWDPMIERISRRLNEWQKAYLSFGGRITLIQSCLTHMPCYFLSLFKIPTSVAAKIERLQKDFLWSGVGEGLFTVKSLFLALSQFSGLPPIFPTKFISNSQVSFKVKSFVWLVVHKKIELQCSPSQFSPIQSMKTKFFEESTNTAFEKDSSKLLAKLLAKVLANRIKKVMGKVILESQNAFVEGRQIWYAVLIANEAVDSRLKDNVGGVLCKLDIEKVYDHVSWSFLLAVLKKMGFGERWIKWIDWCISTVKFSVLINGSPSGFFQSSRGLKQGDPLSPYLFMIAMEVFSSMLRRAISGGYLSGWRVSGRRGEGLQISHLLFEDDTLVFCEESSNQMTYLSWLLIWFEACSGLRINLEKSEMIPWNWRYANEREALWRRVISLKYDEEEGGWRTRDAMGKNGVGLWKAIRKKWGLLDGRLAYHVGNGQRMRFWKDKWCGDGPLCESFSSLFSMSMSKNAWVLEVWNPVGGRDGWIPLFARAFNDWEIDLVERLLQKNHAFKVQREEEDKVIWTALNDGAFSVKSLYSMLERGGSSMFPSERI